MDATNEKEIEKGGIEKGAMKLTTATMNGCNMSSKGVCIVKQALRMNGNKQ